MNKKIAAKLAEKGKSKTQQLGGKKPETGVPEPEMVNKFVLPPNLPWIIKAAIVKAMQPLRDKINDVAVWSCQGAPLDKITKVTIALQITPILQMEFQDTNGNKNAITLDPKLVQDGNQAGYPREANLYIETVKTVLASIPDLRDWQTVDIDFAK